MEKFRYTKSTTYCEDIYEDATSKEIAFENLTELKEHIKTVKGMFDGAVIIYYEKDKNYYSN